MLCVKYTDPSHIYVVHYADILIHAVFNVLKTRILDRLYNIKLIQNTSFKYVKPTSDEKFFSFNQGISSDPTILTKSRPT